MLINRISKYHFFFLNTFVLIVILIIIIGCGGGGGSENGNGNGNGNGEPVISTGSISGMVTSSDGSPLNAVHVRAVNLSNNIQLSAFSGIGSTVNAKLLNTGTNSKLIVQNGLYVIEGVPAGTYRVLIEKMDSRSTVFEPVRYDTFVILNNPTISFPDEYYNGANESSTDNPLESVVVIVNDGQTTQNINFITNDSGVPPPLDCKSPPLNTDFSDRGVFFIDSVNEVLIGITSDGGVVAIVVFDIPDSGVLLGLEGDVLSSTVCDITLGQFIVDGMPFPTIDATGECRLEGNFTVFVIEDLFVAGIPAPADLRGECLEIVLFRTSSKYLIDTLNKTMLDKLQKMADDDQITKEESGFILDFNKDIIRNFHEDILQNQEE